MSTYSYNARVSGNAGSWDTDWNDESFSHELDAYQRANLKGIADYIGGLYEDRTIDGEYLVSITSHGAAFDDDANQLVSRGRIEVVLDPTGDYGTIPEDLDAATADLGIQEGESELAESIVDEEPVAA